ncbi:MAG TPA: aryl-sulfate sulfotransferase, partial [Candidatus Dormibacteraeota bacterium]|nr:aryl-sulfate sulfotransferase [Candidatus Dormibacteraeota bacterium]
MPRRAAALHPFAALIVAVALLSTGTAVPAVAASARGAGRAAPRNAPGPTRGSRPRAGTSDAVVITITGGPIVNMVGQDTSPPSPMAPAFLASNPDYAIRCQAGVNHIQLTLTGGGPISDGSQSGVTLLEPLAVGENQAIEVVDAANPVNYWIRCLPNDFPKYTINKANPVPDVGYMTGTIGYPGFGAYAMILDGNGTPVWYQRSPGGALDVQELGDGTLGWTLADGSGVGTDPVMTVKRFNLDTLATDGVPVPVASKDIHEFKQFADGSRILVSSPLRSGIDLSALGSGFDAANRTVVDCVVQLTDAGGNLLWSWRASDHVSAGEAVLTSPLAHTLNYNGQTAADIYHCNSVDRSADHQNFLVSLRHTSAVYNISRATGQVTWKLGGNSTRGDGAAYITNADPVKFSGQHDARYLPLGHISLFDDQSTLPSGPPTGHAARGVDYAVDLSLSTATPTWQYAVDDGKPSAATGSFRRYTGPGEDDTNLVDWGFTSASTSNSSRITQVDSLQPSPTVLFDVNFVAA